MAPGCLPAYRDPCDPCPRYTQFGEHSEETARQISGESDTRQETELAVLRAWCRWFRLLQQPDVWTDLETHAAMCHARLAYQDALMAEGAVRLGARGRSRAQHTATPIHPDAMEHRESRLKSSSSPRPLSVSVTVHAGSMSEAEDRVRAWATAVQQPDPDNRIARVTLQIRTVRLMTSGPPGASSASPPPPEEPSDRRETGEGCPFGFTLAGEITPSGPIGVEEAHRWDVRVYELAAEHQVQVDRLFWIRS